MMLVVVAGALEGALGAQGQWRWMVDMLALLISMINPSLGGDIFIRLCMREGAYTYVYKCMVLRERVRDAMGM